jgi:hypothetical protein
LARETAFAFLVSRDVAKRFQRNLDAARINAREPPESLWRLAAWKAVEKQLQPTTRDLGQRDFPLRRKDLGPLIKLVRQLDLSPCHAVNFTSLWGDVNLPLHHRLLQIAACHSGAEALPFQ